MVVKVHLGHHFLEANQKLLFEVFIPKLPDVRAQAVVAILHRPFDARPMTLIDKPGGSLESRFGSAPTPIGSGKIRQAVEPMLVEAQGVIGITAML